MARKHIKYRDTHVGPSDLLNMLEELEVLKDPNKRHELQRKIDQHYNKLMDDFHKHWPKELKLPMSSFRN